jgi:signal transduction histidine kinase
MFLCSSFIGIAQNNLPPVSPVEITSDTADSYLLPKAAVQVLEDTTGKLSIDEVSRSPYINRFHTNNVTKINFSAYAFWFRCRLKNMMKYDADITFATGAEFCDFYVQQPGDSVKHLKTGWGVPWSKMDGLKLKTAITLSITPGEEVLIFCRERYNQSYVLPKNIAISYQFEKKAIQDLYINDDTEFVTNTIAILFTGILILAAVFNFFFFTATKDKVYLYFALFAFLDALYPNGDVILKFIFRETPLLRNDIETAVLVFNLFFFVNFFRRYLETFKDNRTWDRILVASSYAYFIILLLFVLLEETTSHFWRLILGEAIGSMSQLISLLLFVASLLYLKQKNAVQSKITPILPVLFYWGPVWSYAGCDELLAKYTGRSQPAVSSWVKLWSPLIELISLGLLVLFFSWSLFRRYQQLQKQLTQQALEKEIERNQLIAQQKVQLEKTVEERTAELKLSLNEIKATQAQLIQSEKMASLGELTAGIAHEIQNPLNFVNNFSEVNKELIEELKSQKSKLKSEEQDEILNDIDANLEKVLHHGKRADSIVKGMLQHSRASTGVKEPTDINKLADEYLRLSYHGMRAKDKSFNAEFKTEFDESIGKINVVPQDIGRVLLNLFNNAFYAVNEKRKTAGENYQPLVTVATKSPSPWVERGWGEVIVTDNGKGIPQNIVDKIFQPFFTTKPTGQGTGLGLSLAYDIIKAHGGEIKVETKEGEGSEFIIQLPV